MFLSNFSSFIQFFAALGLLFTYEKVIKKSPLHSRRTRETHLIREIYFKYGRFVEEDQKKLIEKHLLRKDFALCAQWDDFYKMISVFAALTMMYSLLILFFSGFEQYAHPLVDVYSILGIGVLLFIQLIFVIFFRNRYFGRNMILNSVIFLVLSILVYFIQIKFKVKTIYDADFHLSYADCVTLSVLFCLLPLAIMCIIMLRNYCKIRFHIWKTKKMQKLLEALSVLLVKADSVSEDFIKRLLKILPKSLKDEIVKLTVAQLSLESSKYEELIRKELRTQLNSFFERYSKDVA